VDDYAVSKAEMDRIRPVIREVADNLADSPEINAKLKRYLSHPSIVEKLYLGDLRQKSRPDIYVILKKLGEVLTQGEDGRFFIPEARQETADKFTRLGRALIDTTASMSTQLSATSESLVLIDDLHRRLKTAASDPLFSMVLVKNAFDNADPHDLDPVIGKLKEHAEELARKLPEVFEQTPKGKVLVEKAYAGVTKALDTYDRAKSKVGMLRTPGKQLAARLREGDERLELFRKMLQSDAVLALLDIDVGGKEADPVKYVAAQIRKVADEDRGALERSGLLFNIHALIGGQMENDPEHKLYMVYPQGNWVEIGEGTAYSIIGASGYGKPVLDRTLKPSDPMRFALKVGFLAFDSTRISAADVDFPIDVVLCSKGSYKIIEHRFDKNDMLEISNWWQDRLRHSVNELPRQWMERVFSKLGPEGEIIGMDTVMRPAPPGKIQAAAEQQNQQQQ
jgi:predicted proteasome-type protease